MAGLDLRDLPDPLDVEPDIRSRDDLLQLCEVEDFETGEAKRVTFTYVNHYDTVWFGQISGVRKYDVTVEEYRRHLKRVPDELIYPTVTPGFTISSGGQPATACHVKRPKLLHLDEPDLAKTIAKTFAEEVEIMELLQHHQHPNLIQYHGCTVKNGRVTGIALERHKAILQYRYEDDERPFDRDRCMSDIRAGVKQLHRLGLVHNDLNPSNILLDNDDRAIIIDFDSCRRFGETLLFWGTPGWVDEAEMDEEVLVSAPARDEYAIQKIDAWLSIKDEEKASRS